MIAKVIGRDGSSAHSDGSSPHLEDSSPHLKGSSTHLEGIDPCVDPELLRIAEPVRNKGKVASGLVQETIRSLCKGRFLSLQHIAVLLNRSPKNFASGKKCDNVGIYRHKRRAHTAAG